MSVTTWSDHALLKATAEQGSEAAFTEFVSRHELAGFQVALRILGCADTAQEAVQESLVRVWRSAGSYRFDRNARSWFLTIIVRRCVRLRKLRLKNLALAGTDVSRSPAPVLQLEQREIQSLLNHELLRLKDRERQLLQLYYVQNLSQEHIAKLYKVHQRTVSYRLQCLLKRLRSGLRHVDWTARAGTAA